MCVSVMKKHKAAVVRDGHLPASYTAVSLGGASLLRASEFGFCLPAVGSGSHCKSGGL